MLKERAGNIWTQHPESIIFVTTNGFVKTNGRAVMGRGIAAEAAQSFPSLPKQLGEHIKTVGNVPMNLRYEPYRIITFHVKHIWWPDPEQGLSNELGS